MMPSGKCLLVLAGLEGFVANAPAATFAQGQVVVSVAEMREAFTLAFDALKAREHAERGKAAA
jgi:hypothetical protein